jgi:hypothetical protein
MIHLRPHYSETIVLAYAVDEVIALFSKATELQRKPILEDQSKDQVYFNGIISRDKFLISRKIRSPENFLPLIKGRVEPTSHGTILFLEYKLFFSTILFLGFWTLLTVIGGSLLFFLKLKPEMGLYLLCFGILQYLLCMFFFHRQVDKSRDMIYQLLQTKKMPL